MGFELIIATQRDPDETHEPRAIPRAKPYTAIDVVGVFDDAASSAVLQSVSESHEEGAGSVIVTLNEILDEDTTCLRKFGERIMSLRAAGIEVQVSTPDRHTHMQLGNLADSRDWLLRYSDPASSGPRRAIHLERPTTE